MTMVQYWQWGQSGVQADVAAKATLSGSPAVDLMKRRRIDAAEQKLPDALKELKKLRKELTALKESSTRGTN